MTSPFTVGDHGTTITGQLLDTTTPVDLTGYTVELHLQQPDDTILNRPATITNTTEGRWSYTWAEGELDQDGWWRGEAQITSETVTQTFGPFSFLVQPQIG